MTLHDYLITYNACPEALYWLGDRSPRQAWHACKYPDWKLWLCGRLGVDPRLLVLCATGCARSVLHLVPAGEDRPRLAIEAAEAWAYGRGTAEAAATAASAAKSAVWWASGEAIARRGTGTASWWGAAEAALAAVKAAEATAGGTATKAAQAAVGAADVAGIATRAAALRRYARGVRSVIPWWHVADRLRTVGVEVEA
jgi:hypothetical protein